jgi:hypothetical protein
MTNYSRIRQDRQIQSTEVVNENLNVTDGYLAGQNADGYSLQDDINYIRTAIKNLKGTDSTEDGLQQHFSSTHTAVPIVGDGYGNTKGLPTIESTAPNSINHALWLLNDKVGGGGSVGIGVAEDGYYTDGLFTDFVPVTPVGTAVDRFNEVLKELVPPPAPNLSNIDYDTAAGVAGKLSFGPSNPISGYSNVGTAGGGSALDINASFPTDSLRKGIYSASGSKTGSLAETTTAHLYAYPAKSFGNGDQGTLYLELNGVNIHSVDLSSFGSGSSVNGNGSGFTLSAATAVKFANNNDFSMFKYRTGTWTVGAADQRNGWNYLRVKHTVGSTYTTNYYEWIVDADTTATSFGTATLDNLTLTGSKYISGVRYYTGGDADYDITISNLHRNTYSPSSSAISHPTTTNCDVAAAALGTISTEADQEVIVDKTVTINPETNSRILGGDLVVSTSVDRTVQSDATSTTASGGWRILLDNASSSSSNTVEDFNGESYRQASNLTITTTSGYSSSPGSQPSVWSSSTSIIDGGAGYNDGLIVYNGSLRYPTQGLDSGDFRNVADGNTAGGPTTVGGYSGNPNYSTASGNRVYLRYFYDSSVRQNYRLNVTATSTSFVSVATGPSGNNVTMEILAPNTTTDGSNVVWKDAVTAYTTDNSVGAYASTFGSTIPTNWGVTLGTKSTATSGNVIVVRITASSSWTGSIDNIAVTML